jgi:lysophospholipase L1-like esterase
VPNLDSPGRTIVCLGDSITAGVGAGPGEAYPELLAARLGTEVLNAGEPGDTAAQGLARLDDVLAEDPWMVVVELGGNDILRQVPPEQTERSLRRILDRLLAARVVLFAALVPLLLRLCRLPRLPLWVEPRRRSRARPRPAPGPEEIAALTERIDELLIAGRPAVRAGCMVRGLTLYRFLRLRGADVSLRFGVGTIRGDFAAHCWIVYRGEPLAETHDPRPLFTETWRIGPAGETA